MSLSQFLLFQKGKASSHYGWEDSSVEKNNAEENIPLIFDQAQILRYNKICNPSKIPIEIQAIDLTAAIWKYFRKYYQKKDKK